MGDLLVDLVFGDPHKVEQDVQDEEEGAHIFRPEDILIADVELNGGIIRRSEARVCDNHEHDTIPKWKEWLGLDEEPLLESSLG